MRTKLTLWRILDKYLDEYFKSGMCGYLGKLYDINILTFNESISLFFILILIQVCRCLHSF